MKRMLALVVLLTTGNESSQAYVTGTVTLSRNPPMVNFLTDTDLNTAPNDGWVSYILGVTTDIGVITALEVTIHGFLHQRWTITQEVEGPVITPTPNIASATNGDSHLLAPPTALIGSPLEEDNQVNNDNPFASSPPDTVTRDYGVGSFLRGAWGIAGPEQTNSVNFAYVVVPRVLAPNSAFRIEVGVGRSGGLVERLNTCDFLFAFFGCDAVDETEIGVLGNGIFINDNDSTPRLSDNTEFGTVELGSVQQRTFTIYSLGDVPLTLGVPGLTGPFSIVGAFPSSVGPFTSASFLVALDTTSAGSFVGSISFATSDSNETPFNFNLAARVIPEPATLSLFGLAIVGLVGIARRRG